MRAPLHAALAAAVLSLIPMASLEAQSRLVSPWVASTAPTYERWWFTSLLSTDSFVLSRVEQTTVPMAVSFTPARRWRVDLSASYSRSRVRTVDPDGGAESALALDGFTDARVRAVGRLLAERLWVTLGVDLPIGLTGLSADEALAVRVLGAPALRMRTPVLGSGTGVTAGALYALPLGAWAVAAGASWEMRGTYTPLDLALVDGGRVEADLNPGEVLHFTLGLDRIAGQGRVSILLAADTYGEDLVTVRATGAGPETRSTYRLGPTYAASVEYRGRALGSADLRLSVEARHRSEFSDDDGRSVAGSSGSVVDAGLSLRFGRPRGLGFLVGVGGAFDSGLDVDPSLATAAMTSGEVTVGLGIPAGRWSVQPYARLRVGTLDLGPRSTGARGLTVGLTLANGAS